MKIFEVLTENKSEFLKFIGDTNAGMALGKIIHNHARVNSDQTPTPVKVSSTMKFLEGPKWYAQMFAKGRIYILQGEKGWAALYRRKDLLIDSRAQVELAVSTDSGTRVDSDIINTVSKEGPGSLPAMLTNEIGVIQKTYWIENSYYSRASSDDLKRQQRTSQSPYHRPNVTREFKPLSNTDKPLFERVKILIPSMVIDLKRQIRKSARQGLEPKVDLIVISDALDSFAEDRFYGSTAIWDALGSFNEVWGRAMNSAVRKFKISQYSSDLTVQQVMQVFNYAKSKFIDTVIKKLFVKP
jgi:hypothetical protein